MAIKVSQISEICFPLEHYKVLNNLKQELIVVELQGFAVTSSNWKLNVTAVVYIFLVCECSKPQQNIKVLENIKVLVLLKFQ